MTQQPATWIARFLAEHRLPSGFSGAIASVYEPLWQAIQVRRSAHRGRTLVLGLNGPQGSGKSTGALVLQHLAQGAGLQAEVLSLDDLYLTRAERRRLARDVHPLLATRGPPGTHDCGLGLRTVESLCGSEDVRLPRFDKGLDDRSPPAAWPEVTAPLDLLIFEGWCVGAKPQAPEDLAAPVNALEAVEDADGVWRRYVNHALSGAYQRLFERLDMLVMLRAPDFGCVLKWRLEQEHKLRAALSATQAGTAPHLMSDEEVARFVQLYQRLTEHMAAEMPVRADIVLQLDCNRKVASRAARPQ